MTRFVKLFVLVPLLWLTACGVMASHPYSSNSSAPDAAPAQVPQPGNVTGDKADPEQRFKAALELMKEKHVKEAQEALVDLTRDYPQFSGPLTDLGILYAQGKQPGQAIACLSRAIETNPANAVAMNWLGTVYRARGNFTEAEQQYLKALTVRPDYAEAHLNLGILYDVSMARPHEALEQYRSYQKFAGRQNLIVDAWIKEIETRQAPTVPAALAGVTP